MIKNITYLYLLYIPLNIMYPTLTARTHPPNFTVPRVPSFFQDRRNYPLQNQQKITSPYSKHKHKNKTTNLLPIKQQQPPNHSNRSRRALTINISLQNPETRKKGNTLTLITLHKVPSMRTQIWPPPFQQQTPTRTRMLPTNEKHTANPTLRFFPASENEFSTDKNDNQLDEFSFTSLFWLHLPYFGLFRLQKK